jgi:hypothetical protein
MNGEGQGETENADFAWTRLVPEGKALYTDRFSTYLVHVKSDSAAGHQLLADPVGFFKDNIQEMGLGDEPDVRAMVLRVNAEVPANPRHRSEVWMVYPGSKTAVGVQFKYKEDMTGG